MAKTRDLYWDTLKLVLIFCVVYGHVVQPYRDGSQFNMTVFNFIYSFHMPLFVFISGRFSHFSDRDRYKKSILRVLETLLVFHLIRCFMQLLQGNGIHLSMFTTPSFALWYLAALVYWRILVLLMPEKLKKQPISMIAISICISLIAPFIPGIWGKHFVIERSMTFLPFFVLGYYSVGVDIKEKVKRINPMIAAGYLAVLFVCLYVALQYFAINTATIVHYSFSYWTDNLTDSIGRIGIRSLYIPFVIVTSAMVMRIVSVLPLVAGVISMFVYIYHMFFVDFLKYAVHYGYLPSNELFLFTYTVISFVALLFMSRIKIMVILLNPISYLCSKKLKM